MSLEATPVAIELAAALCIGLSGVPGLLLRRAPGAGQGLATALNLVGSAIGGLGLVLYASGGESQLVVLASLPIGRAAFALDGISALFLIPMLSISALGSLYGLHYWRAQEQRDGGRKLQLCWGIITASMIGVVLARDAIAFLLAWEAMALAGFFLIATEEERKEVREAAWIYLVATHAGTLCLIGFFALLGHAQGSSALWPASLAGPSGWLAGALFALGTIGFGLKAGLMPLHVWLPGAHANAPSHVSALLSGVLLKAGVYGVVRVCGLLPEPPIWQGCALIGIGVLSGVLGIAFALAQQDLKRLLAYSSIENVGIIAIGVGLASIGRSLGRADLVALGLGGALFHVLNHSLMKPLLFFVAGSVLHATGTRQLSALGGLGQRMPRTFALFVVGAVAICGAPPLNGFSSELLLYLGLLRAASAGPAEGFAWAGLAVPALALIGALAVASFVKVAGIAFGGLPRSAAPLSAHDPGGTMLAPMGLLAAGCLGLGLLPAAALPLLDRAVAAWAAAPGLPSLAVHLPLGWVSLAGLSLLAAAALGAACFGRTRAPRAPALTWDCGYAVPTPRMQYVSGSFSETLVGLFDWALRSERTPIERNGLFPSRARFRIVVPDAVLDRAIFPLLAALDRPFSRLRALQRGPVQMYLLYVLLAVVSLLVVAR